jgi:hypothetical protein
MKKPGNFKGLLLAGMITVSLFVLGLICLPSLTEFILKNMDLGKGVSVQSLRVEKAGFWGSQLADVELHTPTGRIVLNRLDLRYDPWELGGGAVRVVSVTSPSIELDIHKLVEELQMLKTEETDQKSLQAETFHILENPPLNHLRIRDGWLNLSSESSSLQGDLQLKMDLHPELAQLQLDGNWSGFPFKGDLTLIKEGMDIFLGAKLDCADMSPLPSILETVGRFAGGLNLDLSSLLNIQRGAGFVRWTGRMEEDGIMDQFLELNATELNVQTMGMELDIPQSIFFFTPLDDGQFDASLYANINFGSNLILQGMKLSTSLRDGNYKFSGGIKKLSTIEDLTSTELIGLTVDRIDFAKDEDGEIIHLQDVECRFSAFHYDEGIFNLYDGEVFISWLGEDRYKVEIRKANGSLPTVGLNFSNLTYSGEIALNEFPHLKSYQTLEIEEAILGEEMKVEDFTLQFKMESSQRLDVKEVSMRMNEFEFSIDPANLAIEFPNSSDGRVDLSLLSAQLSFEDHEEIIVKNILGNLRFNSLDPIDSNGSQNIRFDLQVGEEEITDAKLEFEFFPDGVKTLGDINMQALGGSIRLPKVKISDDLSTLEVKALVEGVNAQELINYFEDLDADMEGNLSGVITVHNHPEKGWDFYGGSLTLDHSDDAVLSFRTHGLLSDGLNPESSDFERMKLLERALENLSLEDLNILFKVIEDGERIVEMNIRGSSKVDGKEIGVEYRPKIIGGLDALIQQANLLKSSSGQ